MASSPVESDEHSLTIGPDGPIRSVKAAKLIAHHATVVVSPKEYGITRWGTTKPVKVILDATLKRV
jgi:hypothetical protein